MRLGCDLPYLRDPGAIRAFAQAAEAIGYDHLAFSEHVATSPSSPFPPRIAFDDEWHETYTLLGFLSGVTSRIELMSSMHLLPLRPAVLAAKQAAEIDLLSGGRLRLGVAVGWNPREYDALGVRPDTRGQLLEEQIEVLRLLWSRDVVTYRGRFIDLDEVAIRPRPGRAIPIWIGAGSSATHGRPTARALRRIARLADGYKMFAPLGASPEKAQEIVVELRDQVRAAGRSVDEVGIETRLLPHVTPRHKWAEHVRWWAEAGTTHLGLGNRMAGGDVDAQIALIADVKAEIDDAHLAPVSARPRTLVTDLAEEPQ